MLLGIDFKESISPAYVAWRNQFLGIDSWARYIFMNSGSGSWLDIKDDVKGLSFSRSYLGQGINQLSFYLSSSFFFLFRISSFLGSLGG